MSGKIADPLRTSEPKVRCRIKPRRSWRANDKAVYGPGEEVMVPESIVAASPHIFEDMDAPTTVESDAESDGAETRAVSTGRRPAKSGRRPART